MKDFDSRAYSINDFLEWDRNNQLELNPRFQRRSVWTDSARSYLMDTIIRGKPIPKVFIRQKLNVLKQASVREVVDGQQRLRTILSYVKDGFQIKKGHNSKYGGLFFSQLGSVDDQIQTNILNYEIAVDLLVNMTDPDVLDVFSRLNTYAVTLNEQELLNAQYFGPFKALADKIGHKYYDWWITNGILTSQQILRMGDAALVADLLVTMLEGIKNRKQVKTYYKAYEKEFAHDQAELESNFDDVMNMIGLIFIEGLKSTEFTRPPVFYSLWVAFYHVLFGLKDFPDPPPEVTTHDYPRIRISLDVINRLFATKDIGELVKAQRDFLEDTRKATTDPKPRLRRTQFILTLIKQTSDATE